MSRLTLIAGSGTLVSHVLPALQREGEPLQVLDLVGRDDIEGEHVVRVRLSAPDVILDAIKQFKTTHLAFAGGVHISDAERDAISEALGPIGRFGRSLGDVGLTSSLYLWARFHGYKLVGVQTLAPELVAGVGLLAGEPLPPETVRQCRGALRFARAIGAIDLGQSVITSGTRLLAAEDIGGTDALLQRVAELRQRGLTGNGRAPLILAKALKPKQPKFVDLPSIGPQTVQGCQAAGISIIVVEAGSSLILERERLADLARQAGITVIGLRSG